MMIGIFGGTFDPVHFGHLRTGLEVCERLDLDEMRWVPSRQPPHRRQPKASAPDRLHMLELALRGGPACFKLDGREMERDGPSYMVDTLASMHVQWPSARLCLVLGQDAFLGLPSWHRWRELFDLSHFVVMRRPGALHMETHQELSNWVQGRMVGDADGLREHSAGKVHLLDVTQLPISATAIRDMLELGRSPDFLLPAEVAAYIRSRGLYA